jgi:thiol-disulfide isomerase/thioredoxin
MNSATPASEQPSAPGQLPPELESILEQAYQFQQKGEMDRAVATLESALADSRQDEDNGHKARFVLAMMLPQYHLSNGSVGKALQLLDTEVAFAGARLKDIKLTGTTEQRQYANRVFVELRDYQSRLKLLGQLAPEISVKEWIKGEPVTLAALRGQVVLLEFWATWCKPCEQLFPRIKELHAEHAASGLNVLALTRFFMAYGGPPEAKAQEITLIREFAQQNTIEFPVGVAEDETVQSAYGATALPMLALIDRTGVVRSFAFSPDEENFKAALAEALA